MAIELEKRELRSYELRKKKHKQQMTLVVAIGLTIAVIIGTFLIKHILDKNYKTYEVVHTTKREDSSSARYSNYKSGVVRYSRDGIMAMDGTGKMLWNGTFEMKNPILDICEDYVAIADKGSKMVQIYSGKGQPKPINVLNNIMEVEVANQGVIAVLMEANGSNIIEMYSEDGTWLTDFRTTNVKNGFPIDIDLSNDGRKLVTSYMFLNNGVVQNKVTFYNFGPVGKSYTDKVVGSYDYGQTIVPKVEFVNNDTVAAFGDHKISIYSVSNVPKLIHEEEFENEIRSVIYNEKYIGVVLSNNEGEDKNQFIIYDLKGNVVLNQKNNYEYKTISISGEDIIMYTDTGCTILKVNGEEKFNTTFDRNISYVFPVNNADKFILIDDVNMEEIKLMEE
jgi:hypothetical protein